MSDTVPSEIADLLTSEPLVAHLATCCEKRPHVAPLWYRYEDGIVELMTTGRKLANVRENPRVALSVQKDEDGHPEWMVALQGHATAIEDEATAEEANRKLNRKYGIDEDAWQENTLVRVEIGSVSHKQF